MSSQQPIVIGIVAELEVATSDMYPFGTLSLGTSFSVLQLTIHIGVKQRLFVLFVLFVLYHSYYAILTCVGLT